MPELAPTTSGQQGGQPSNAPPQQQGQPPAFGSSPVTGPSQNLGLQAAGQARVGMLVKLASDTLPLVGATSDIGRELVDVIKRLTKLIPAGASTPQTDQASMQKMQMQAAQQSAMAAKMRQQQAQGGAPQQGGPPPAPPTGTQG